MELMSIMRIVATGAAVAGSLLAFAPAVSAQATGPATECAAGAGASYQRCALWLDGRRVRRGADGAVVGEPGFFSPLRLTRIVEGDSALTEARRFERSTATSGVFGLLSALSLSGAWIVVDSHDCRRDPTIGVCTTTDDAYTAGAIALLAGGLVSGIISGVFQRRASRAANRAVFWHNANFAR
jgi:hypothetical protein